MSSLLFFKIFRTLSSQNFAEKRPQLLITRRVKKWSLQLIKKSQLNSGIDKSEIDNPKSEIKIIRNQNNQQ